MQQLSRALMAHTFTALALPLQTVLGGSARFAIQAFKRVALLASAGQGLASTARGCVDVRNLVQLRAIHGAEICPWRAFRHRSLLRLNGYFPLAIADQGRVRAGGRHDAMRKLNAVPLTIADHSVAGDNVGLDATQRRLHLYRGI